MYTAKAKVQSLERGMAVLRFENGQELLFPKRQLPSRLEVGSLLVCEFYLAEDAEERRQNVAQYLLKEVLNSHEQVKNPNAKQEA